MSVRRLAEKQPASFAFTPENEAWAQNEIAKYPAGRQASAIIPLLWKAQTQNDYWLSKPAIEKVADMLGMPHIRALEIATFYSMFNLAPVGKHFIQLCGTTPCMLRGAEDLKKVCEKRIGEQRQVSADGNFAWLEVECLGACCNAPMVQINDDYYEDLTPESLGKLLDDLAAGRPVKKGSLTGRTTSEPEPGKATTLTDTALFDGSVVGAWKQRFADDKAKAEAAAIEAEKAKAAAAVAAAAPTEKAKAENVPGSSPVAPTAGAGGSTPSAPATPASATGASTTGATSTAAAPESTSVSREAMAVRDEADIKAKLATLDKNATPEQKANAVGSKPVGLPAARNGVADDLKRVKGIGPVNEGKLNLLGIFHFDQIAGWSRAEIRWIGTFLAFPGRIDREDWLSQAKLLASGAETEFSRRVDKGEVPTSAGGASRPDMKK